MDFTKYPHQGKYEKYGGQFIPETLMLAVTELEQAYREVQHDTQFQNQLQYYLKKYAGRPTPLYHAENLTSKYQGPKIYLKREDLAHSGAHKINNTLGQALLAKKMRKKRIVAETGAGLRRERALP